MLSCPERRAIPTLAFSSLHNLISTVPSKTYPAYVILIKHALTACITMSTLPTSRHFVTQLLDSLPSSAHNAGQNGNPLSAVDETARKQLLSLQVLFPNEFLPALDLLDRGLVTRLRIGDGEEGDAEKTEGDEAAGRHQADQAAQGDDNEGAQHDDVPMPDAAEAHTHAQHASPSIHAEPIVDHPMTNTLATITPPNTTYYVRSAQQRSSRYTTSYDTLTSYEVRLLAWNCSCPAFAFAAFPSVHPEPTPSTHDQQGQSEDTGWLFGGVSLGDTMPPVCKHLLACVLVERCKGLFGGFVEERVVSVEEAAGWAAGWGDS